jgi:menaquinone-dependent protoporphyrinogen oxidase
MPKQVLIVYGTRFGATAGTAEEIARVLHEEGLEVKVINAKKQKVGDISAFELIIVGSGMMINRWTGEAEQFLNRFRVELAHKKTALFVSSGAQALIEQEGKYEEFHFGGKTTVYEGAEATGRPRIKYLEEKAAQFGLQPVSLALFGGVWDFNHMPWWSGKAMEAARPKLAAAGIKEVSPGVYDTRDWEAIRKWARELAGVIQGLK